jgi:signal transduction histidine kinase
VSKGVLLRSKLSEGCYIRATGDSVHQVIFNLIENAIKYTEPVGSVFVRLSLESKNVILSVLDRGVGVPEEDIPYIFDRFYRVDKARSREAGGSGLGLAIVRETVKDLGGKVTARNRKDGGMSFDVVFNLYEEQGESFS